MLVIHLHHAEEPDEAPLYALHPDRDVRRRLTVLGKHRRVIEAVDVVGMEDEDVAAARGKQPLGVGEQRVRRAALSGTRGKRGIGGQPVIAVTRAEELFVRP